jgi:hypothetical protein
MRICVLPLSAVLCLPASLMADTIFSNFGPGNPYSTVAGADIGGMPGQVQGLLPLSLQMRPLYSAMSRFLCSGSAAMHRRSACTLHPVRAMESLGQFLNN